MASNSLENPFKQLVIGRGWWDEPYAEKTWNQGESMHDRDEFFRKVELLLRWSKIQNFDGRCRVLCSEIAGFVNDRGAMRQRLTAAEQQDRDEFSEAVD